MKKYTPLNAIIQKKIDSIPTQGLDAPIRGSGRLPVGWHKVVISAVDTLRLDDLGRFSVTLDDGGHTHVQSVFLYNKDKSDLSYQFRQLIKGLFAEDNACREFLQAMLPDNDVALHMIRGMKLDVDIQPGPGYIIDSEEGKFVAKNAQTGQPLSPQLDSIQRARQTAEAGGHKRSYNRIQNVEPTNSEDNLKALQNAREAIAGAENSNSISLSDLVTD